ncbi:MAG: hypothetical protein GC165_04215 [Armatimonadetes bacterium]|nr:hypothetical protein [Armatimonadota bacterium]
MGHVIVCGLGQVGYRVTTLLLRMGKPVTVVALAARSEFEREVAELGARVVVGDARDRVVLEECDIGSAESLIACTDSDLTNIEISLDAQGSNPNLRVIARLFDQTLARRLEESVGIHRALAMSVLAAPSFAATGIGSDVIGAFDHGGRTYSVHLSDDGKVDVRPSLDVRVRQSTKPRKRFRMRSLVQNIPPLLTRLLLAIFVLIVISTTVFAAAMHLSVIDALYFVITTLTTTGYGDISVKDHAVWLKLYACAMMLLGSAAVATLYSIITDYLVSARFDEIFGRQQVSESEHIIVVGLGNVGFRIAEALDKMGYSVVAIDNNANAKYRTLLPPSIVFVAGDGRDDETLRRAGIETATSVISATHDDAINLSTCLMAKGLNPSTKVVVRLFDGGFARKVERALDVDMALSASRISAPGFVGAAIVPDSVFSFVTQDEFVSILPKGDGFEFVHRRLV